MRTNNSLYTLLQVLPDADPSVIEAAYKALMKKYHPDRVGGEDAERRAAAISHAFNVLRDPDRRAAYDAEEKERDDRYRVELSRSVPVQAGSPHPGRRPPPPSSHFERSPRPGQRFAAWIGAAGALALAGTVVLFARDRPRTTIAVTQATPGDEAQDSDANPAAAPVPFRDQPVSRERVQKAVMEFDRLASVGGLPAVASFSERCFEVQASTLSVSDFDFCVAFDQAAGRTDFPDTKRGMSDAARRFQPQNQVARHVRAADPMADTFSSIELRLFDIRRMADSVLSEVRTEAEPRIAPVSPAAAHKPQRFTGRTRREAPRATAGRSDQDFLEREGGIY